MLPIRNVTYTKCYLYKMLPIRNVTYTKCYLDEMLLYKNVLYEMLLYENVLYEMLIDPFLHTTFRKKEKNDIYGLSLKK